jgi:hypothetical protein
VRGNVRLKFNEDGNIPMARFTIETEAGTKNSAGIVGAEKSEVSSEINWWRNSPPAILKIII